MPRLNRFALVLLGAFPLGCGGSEPDGSDRNSSAVWGLNFDDGFTGFNSGSAAWNTFGPSYTKCVRDE